MFLNHYPIYRQHSPASNYNKYMQTYDTEIEIPNTIVQTLSLGLVQDRMIQVSALVLYHHYTYCTQNCEEFIICDK